MKEVVQLQDLIDNAHQPDRDGVQKLADSMMAIGQVTPIVVVPSGDKFVIVAGHRRVKAAKQLGWTEIEAVVHEGDEQAQVAALAADNLQRKDFTDVQIGMLVQTLFDLGAPEEMVSDITGFKPKVLKEAAKIYSATKETENAEHYLSMTLDEAEAFLAVEGQPDLNKELGQARGTDQWSHTASRVMRKARERIEVAKATEQLEAEDCTVVPVPSWDSQNIVGIEKLGITKAKHKKCGGHAACIGVNWEGKAHITYLCLDAPAYHDYKPKASSSHDDKQKAKATKGREFRKAMLPATEVRREWIVGKLKDVTKLKGRHDFLVEHFVSSRHGTRTDAMFALAMGIKLPEKFDRYYVVDPVAIAKIGKARREQLLYAAVVAWCEEELRLCQGPEGDTEYRIGEVQHYLRWLKLNGYVTSPEEEQLIDWVKPEPKSWNEVNAATTYLETVEVDEFGDPIEDEPEE